MKSSVDQGKAKSDALIETLRAVLDETDLAILEIKKDAFDFQRDILNKGDNSMTGKIEAERIIKHREEKIKQKEATIKKYQTKKDNLSHQVAKLIAQIKKKDELGDDLKFIDFHQLQIENKKYLKEIDDKNDKLLKMKINTGTIVKTWNDKKLALNKEMTTKVDTLKNLRDAKKQYKLVSGKITDYVDEAQNVIREVADLEQKNKKNEKDDAIMNIPNFIKDKNHESLFKTKIKNYSRKIEIMSLKFKQTLRMMGMREDDVQAEVEAWTEKLHSLQKPPEGHKHPFLADDEVALLTN